MTMKSVFILFFSGEQLRTRIKKICSGFGATTYNCPELPGERAKLLSEIRAQVEDMKGVILKTSDYKRKVINAASVSIKKWDIMVLKLKSIFHTLNFFSIDVTQKLLIAECWVPTVDIQKVQDALTRGTHASGSNVIPVMNIMDQHHRYPPTYFKLNKFTQGYQNIVDAYGIASYREINPAPWTIISFPFLFAVMFGDAGHGIIMFLAAASLLVFEKQLIAAKIKDEIFNTFFSGRYVIFLMGLFAIYTGLIYNDIYSKSINIFGSSWRNPYDHALLAQMDNSSLATTGELDLTFPPDYAYMSDWGPYPFGVDPVWNLAKNRLNFLNPMKMKTSVLLGISQMAFGVMLSLLNYCHRGSLVDIFFVFIPQCIFLGFIFVYLCIQIVVKWIVFWVKPKWIFGRFYPGSNCAPSLLIGLISMFMVKSRDAGFVHNVVQVADSLSNTTCARGTIGCGCITNDVKDCYNYTIYDQCGLQQWYPQQSLVELILLAGAVLAIPTMLLVKPFYIRWRHNRGLPIDLGHGHEDGEEQEFSFGDVMVYQAIHTIEFALGCISHTASYLRLWALSLAHAQLSEVLWSMVLDIPLKMSGIVGIVALPFVTMAFLVLAISILILMEGLSAFLHALRLHWVEFMSKFYGGTGVAFQPFCFEKIIRVFEGLDQ
ncbi:hypothetical protein WR25_27151 isoform B [Diploscapter pachys]|uniref:V-type proton ATPase subunit a n=1 Tax=Diploscapter pachys TaxID=2018661 RepID=A0A2A2LW82_9BILA|nr:hypothetical protein WR25_27151 isoform A [Diploscapter pachys]PAV90501.1 hypothetical protein WR25_27151 isoform B [Diploscapter pachys]